jgi:aminoglycoside/choline kinase family phosphotransferase
MSEDAFLAAAGWSDATKSPLAGDASSRRYTRLTRASGTAILMDDGPDARARLDRFTLIARHLIKTGLSAPKILADESDQFLLLEDLGDAVFADVMADQPALEIPLYKAAIDALIRSQKTSTPNGISPYGPVEMTAAAELAFEWYPTPDVQYEPEKVSEILNLLKLLLEKYLTGPNVLIQRDFHAENLIWLPERDGVARVGLLDFQDAVSGHNSYDLASLLVDARRYVSPEIRQQMIGYYCEKTGAERARFETALALCSAQRNLRILGIFSRLAIRENKPGYIDLIPRVWNNLKSDLTHPALSELQRHLIELLPDPTPEILTKIRSTNV